MRASPGRPGVANACFRHGGGNERSKATERGVAGVARKGKFRATLG
ncbi:MAG: hypothetical protein RL153_736, partial [Verrucomicrobiota bacterium]